MLSKARQFPALSRSMFHNGLFVALSFLGSVLSYLLYPILAKILTPAQFGDVSVVVSLSAQIGGILVAFNVVSLVVINSRPAAEAKKVLEAIQKILLQVFLVTSLLVLIFSPMIMQSLHIANVLTLVGLCLLLIAAVPTVVWTSYLQGNQRLGMVGIYNVLSAFLKVVIAAGLALAGLGAAGTIGGVILGQVLGLAFLAVAGRGSLPSLGRAISLIRKNERALARPFIPYTLRAIVVVATFSILFAADIILAKYFFNEHLAGLYAGVAALARVIFYGSAIIMWVLLAHVSDKQPMRENRKWLVKSLGFIMVCGVVAIVGMWYGRELIVGVSLGASYLEVSHLLWLAAIGQLLVSALYMYASYLLVVKKGWPVLLSVLVGASTVALLAIRPTTLEQVVYIYAGGQLIGCAAYWLIVLLRKLIKFYR